MANQAEELSRAEKVRARRKNNRTKKPKTTIGSNATRKPKSQHATVTRRSSGTVPVVTRKKHTAYVPLKNKGAELQIPAFPTLQLGWRLISGAIVLLSLAVVFSFTTLSTFKISSINLRGAERLSPEAILLQLDLAGTSIIRVEPEQIKAQIEDQFPSVKSVSVSVGLPSSVTIQVEERVPVVLWEQENSTYWIDAEGVMFPAIGEVEVAQSVVAVGDPHHVPEVFTAAVDDDNGEITSLFEHLFIRTNPDF
jgi:hypothetical protein